MAAEDRTGIDREVLAAVFASRVTLAKKTEDEAVADARAEWHRCQKWIASTARLEQSFLWFCDYFDLEASAVRKAIAERRQ